MKLISWNVAGFRACLKKGFEDFFVSEDADIYCLQEVKAEREQIPFDPQGYTLFLNPAEKKGYSGTAIFTRKEPVSVAYGISEEEFNHEGRVITLESPDFYMITVYTPNSQDDLRRLSYRMQWEEAFLRYIQELDAQKPVIFCGDLNVAHTEIDLKNPKSNTKNAGFTPEEREKMSILLNSGFVDTFRFFFPDARDMYSWWSYRFQARERNAGWRIDYFIVSERLKPRLQSASIHSEIFGSDHCPVELVVDL